MNYQYKYMYVSERRSYRFKIQLQNYIYCSNVDVCKYGLVSLQIFTISDRRSSIRSTR